MNNIINQNERLSARLFQTTMRVLRGGGNSDSPDDDFALNIKKNQLSILKFTGIFIIVTLLILGKLYNKIDLPDTRIDLPAEISFLHDTVIANIFSKAGLAIIPHLTFAMLFIFIWRGAYNGFALRIEHSRINKTIGAKGLATISISLMIASFPILLLATLTTLQISIYFFYLISIVAMLFATFFALIYLSVLDEGRELGGYDTAIAGANQPFYSLDTTSYGWLATNFLTMLCLIGMFIYLIYHGNFHTGWSVLYTSDGSRVIAGRNFTQALGIEALYLSTLVVIGYFSGAFRTPIWVIRPDRNREILDLNAALQTGGSSTGKAMPAKANEQKPDESGSTPNNTTSFISLQAFLVSSRLFQSIASGLLLFSVSGHIEYSIAFALLLALSYSFNDILDFVSGKDLVSHPKRPLPSGTLSMKGATVGCAILAAAFALQVAKLPSDDGKLVLIYGLIISGIYSLFLKRLFPSFATPIWGAMVVFLFLWATNATFLVYALCLAFFLGRELLLDVRDEFADRQFSKFPSLATLLGPVAKPIALLVMLSPLAILATFNHQNQLLILGLVVLFGTSLAISYRRPSQMELVSKFGYLFVLLVPLT